MLDIDIVVPDCSYCNDYIRIKNVTTDNHLPPCRDDPDLLSIGSSVVSIIILFLQPKYSYILVKLVFSMFLYIPVFNL